MSGRALLASLLLATAARAQDAGFVPFAAAPPPAWLLLATGALLLVAFVRHVQRARATGFARP
jgi:hypothetical protein